MYVPQPVIFAFVFLVLGITALLLMKFFAFMKECRHLGLSLRTRLLTRFFPAKRVRAYPMALSQEDGTSEWELKRELEMFPGVAHLKAHPQILFRPERLVLSSDEPLDTLIVTEMLVGQNSALVCSNPIPASAFSADASGVEMMLPVPHIGQRVLVRVQRDPKRCTKEKLTEPLNVRGTFFGLAVE